MATGCRNPKLEYVRTGIFVSLENHSHLEANRNERNALAFALFGATICFVALIAFYLLSGNGTKNWDVSFPVILTVFIAGGVIATAYFRKLRKHHDRILAIIYQAESKNQPASQHTPNSSKEGHIASHQIAKIKKHSARRARLFLWGSLVMGLLLVILPTTLLIGTKLTSPDLREIYLTIFFAIATGFVLILAIEFMRKLLV